ncbi:MAG: hypothetical protein ACFE8F_12405, partial [Promethearchaeota archaeon]
LKKWVPDLILYVIIVFCAFLPMFTAIPSLPWDRPSVVLEVILTSAALYILELRIGLHLVTLLLLGLLLRYSQQAGRITAVYFGGLFLFQAITQNIAVTPTYGLAILTGNLVIIAIAGMFWFWEAYRPRTDFSFRRLPLWRYWVVPFVVLAYWFPVGPDLLPYFHPFLLLTSDFGVMFCPTAPLVIALLTLYYPRVDVRLLRVTSLVGFLIGCFNILSAFVMPGYTLWMLFLHTPLIFISFYGLVLPWLIRPSVSSVES